MKVVIVGGSHAGIACARRCREEFPDAEVLILERKEDVSFVSQTIPLFLENDGNILEESHYTSPEELEAEGIHVLIKKEVKTVETDKKRLTYEDVETEKLDELFYDKLVMATGSYPVLPLVDGVFNETFFLLKNMEDAVAIKQFMRHSQNVVIVGAGIVGVELARIFSRNNMKVTMIQRGEQVLDHYLDPAMSKVVEEALGEEGVQLKLNTQVTDYHTVKSNLFRHQAEVMVETDQGEKLRTQGVVISVGFRPNSYLLRGQVELGDRGAILVDEYMQTSVPDVFAVGDCATTYFTLLKTNSYNPHASEAIRQGAIAAINLMEKKAPLPCSLGTYKLNMKGYTIAVTGITQEVAYSQGYIADAVYFENQHLDKKYFSFINLVYEREKHTILGFQVVGNTSANEYVNIISVAIEHKMTIDEIEFSDFYFEHGYKDPSGFTKILARLVREKERDLKNNDK